jgi:hypothetical protein
MGEQRQGRRPRRALAAALFITLAWPATALAQDAIDIDSSFTAFAPALTSPEAIIADPTQEPVRLFGEGVPLTYEVNCTNDPGHTLPKVEELRRRIGSATGAIGATYTSNASESDGGEDDILTTTNIRLERIQRSRDGLCRQAGPGTIFDPERAYSLYANSLSLAFAEDNGADASRFTVGGYMSWALDNGAAFGGRRFQTRATVSLDNNVTYLGLYQNWISTTHDLRVGVSHILNPRSTDGPLTLRGAVGRVFANPERSSYNLATVSLTREWQPNDKWTVAVAGAVTYNEYADAEPEDFADTRYRLGVTVGYTLAPDLVLETSANIEARTSDIPVREFEAMSMPFTIRFVRKF